MVENSSSGLLLLRGEATVTVTREERHQAELARYAPGAGERRVAVELGWCTITSGKHRGERAVEVRLDGRRIGELTYLMSRRYGPLVGRVEASGARPGCEALIQHGEKKIEVVLRLPRDVDGAFPPAAPAEPVTMPIPVVPVPQPTSVFHPVAAPATATQHVSAPAPRRPWYHRRPLWIAAAVVALFLFIGIVSGGEEDERESTSDVVLPTTTMTTTPPVTTTTEEPEPTTEPPPEPPAAPPEPTYSEPAPEPVVSEEAAPPPPPPPPPAPEPECHPSYEGACVPIASDVDCEGGSGNGPAYVRGPVQVVGPDEYGLDRNGDGVACED